MLSLSRLVSGLILAERRIIGSNVIPFRFAYRYCAYLLQPKQRQWFVNLLGLSAVSLTLYLLTFNGLFTSIDELALYAKSESMIQAWSFQTPQLEFADYHNPVGPTGIGFSIVAAPFYYLGSKIAPLNSIQTVMLLNPLLTAATVGFLYLTLRRLQYAQRASILAALGYAFATLAWPYARTFYREPLVAFGWTVGLFGLVMWRLHGRSAWGLAALVALGLTMMVKVTAISGIPFLLLAGLPNVRIDRHHLGRYVKVGSTILFATLNLFVLAFTFRFDLSALDNFVLSWFENISLVRVYGLLLSPGKGLLFYSPILLLAVPGFVRLWRRYPNLAAATGLAFAAQVISYSGYAVWYGGQSWGPRFLIPSLPLLIPAIAAFLDSHLSRFWRLAVFALATFSVLIQASAAAYDWWEGYRPLFHSAANPENTTGLSLAHIRLSPPLVQLKMWASREADLLWLHPGAERDALTFSTALFAALLLAFLLAVALWWLVQRRGARPVWLLVPPLLSIGSLLFLGPAAAQDYGGLPRTTMRELSSQIVGASSEPFTLVTVSNEFHINRYLGFLQGDFVHHWYSPHQRHGFDSILQHTKGERLTLVVDRVHLPPEFSGKELEYWLNERLYRASSTWVDGYELVNYALLPTETVEWHPIRYEFGGRFALGGYAVTARELRGNDVLGVALIICRTGPMPEFHHLFVHLHSPQMTIHGFDGPIRYGQLQLAPWQEGTCLIERRALPVPAGSAAGVYDIIMGFETPDHPLMVTGRIAPQATYATLGQVRILE